ncbi:hypothetical protein QR98_0061570 [Sarcoptes scabiei]|uniref:Uncharacterized protein n=1 Tax=Sarcoptes scabiei TaxID=52283 RepID=A0A132A9N1_SARSC|nr:hypothetical protein QR98_0061570 [Sarcoptes scabiei]
MDSIKELSWRKYVNIRQLKIEPFVLLYMIGFSLSSMAVSQLVQDKLCRVDYDQSSVFCISINSIYFDHGAETIKSDILKDSTYITLYRTLLQTLPCVIWALFLGPWTDKFPKGRKYIMIFGAFTAILESIILIINASFFKLSGYYVLLSFIPSALSGGIIAVMMAVYAYCSATSDEFTRSTRFATVEICFYIAYTLLTSELYFINSAQPIGLFIGGQILGNGNETNKNQLYNYIPVFVVSLCAYMAAVVWAALVIKEKRSTLSNIDNNDQSTISSQSDSMEDSVVAIVSDGVINADYSINDCDSELNQTITSVTSLNTFTQRLWKQFCKIFDAEHVHELCNTLTKERPHWGRGQIWLLFVLTAFLLLVYLNPTFILWSYVEKLYSWRPKFYSNITSATAIITLILMGLLFPILVRNLNFGDMKLSLLGIISLMAQCILRGSWQHEIGLYLSFFAGTLAPLSFIGIRSRISKIIGADEFGKLFALLAIIEALTPGIASLFYSLIFTSSIDVYPGLAFQVVAFILIFPLLSIIFIDINCTYDYDQRQSH